VRAEVSETALEEKVVSMDVTPSSAWERISQLEDYARRLLREIATLRSQVEAPQDRPRRRRYPAQEGGGRHVGICATCHRPGVVLIALGKCSACYTASYRARPR
jgi:hypothetical protein